MLQSADSNISQNNWHHIAFSYDESGVNLFVDGILSSSNLDVSIDTTVNSLSNIVLGSNVDGLIDNVKLFDTALSTEQIQHLAFSGNYEFELSNKVTDLKFNEFEAVPQILKNESGKDASISGANPIYTSGYVEGSKALVMNQADISLNDTIALGELSMSVWVNLDNLTSGENVIVENTAMKFYLDDGVIKLKFNDTEISFTDETDMVVSLKGEMFNLNFNTGNDLDTSPYAATNNQGVVSTTVNNGTFNNDVVTYPNVALFTDKLTLSSWVKTNTDGTIFDLGNVNLSVNSDKLDVSIKNFVNTKKTHGDVIIDNITNNNNVSGIVGNNFNELLIATNSIDFTLNTNEKTKLIPSSVSFVLPLRHYSPNRVIISGIINSTENQLLNESIHFMNSKYKFTYNITTLETEYDSIKVKFEGNGILKVSNMEMVGYNIVEQTVYEAQDFDFTGGVWKNIGYTGGVIRNVHGVIRNGIFQFQWDMKNVNGSILSNYFQFVPGTNADNGKWYILQTDVNQNYLNNPSLGMITNGTVYLTSANYGSFPTTAPWVNGNIPFGDMNYLIQLRNSL